MYIETRTRKQSIYRIRDTGQIKDRAE